MRNSLPRTATVLLLALIAVLVAACTGLEPASGPVGAHGHVGDLRHGETDVAVRSDHHAAVGTHRAAAGLPRHRRDRSGRRHQRDRHRPGNLPRVQRSDHHRGRPFRVRQDRGRPAGDAGRAEQEHDHPADGGGTDPGHGRRQLDHVVGAAGPVDAAGPRRPRRAARGGADGRPAAGGRRQPGVDEAARGPRRHRGHRPCRGTPVTVRRARHPLRRARLRPAQLPGGGGREQPGGGGTAEPRRRAVGLRAVSRHRRQLRDGGGGPVRCRRCAADLRGRRLRRPRRAHGSTDCGGLPRGPRSSA